MLLADIQYFTSPNVQVGLNRNENSTGIAFSANGGYFRIYSYMQINGICPLLQIMQFRYYTSWAQFENE